MASLYLSDLISRIAKDNPALNLDLKKIMLIRHSMGHKRFKKCYDKGFYEDYQRIQKNGFFNNWDYLLSFVSDEGTSAKFLGMYEVTDRKGISVKKAVIPQGFPATEMFDNEANCFFGLQPSELMSDLKGRLIINWGKGARAWYQRGTNEKEVLAIQANPKYIFSGFENLILDYQSLKDIIGDPTLYESYHIALSSVNAIYLIVDTETGKQYVGSAYGQGGLLGRWKEYIASQHGNNKLLIELLKEHPNRHESFQFSILQIIPKSSNNNDVIALENLFKNKLMTIKHGLNDN